MLAVPAGEARVAVAVIRANLVDARAAVLARLRQALVQVALAIGTLEAGTRANVAAVVVVANAIVEAWIVPALVNIDLARGTLVTVKIENYS